LPSNGASGAVGPDPSPGNGKVDPEIARLRKEHNEMRQRLEGAELQRFDHYMDSFVNDERQIVRSLLETALPDLANLLGGEAIAEPYIAARVQDVLNSAAGDQLFMSQLERKVRTAYQRGDSRNRDAALQEF